VVGFGPCDEFGFAEAVLEVSTQSATGDVLRAFVYDGTTLLERQETNVTTNPMTIRITVRGDGMVEDIRVNLGANEEVVSFTTPVCPESCIISEFSLVSVGPCRTTGSNLVGS